MKQIKEPWYKDNQYRWENRENSLGCWTMGLTLVLISLLGWIIFFVILVDIFGA